MTCDPGAYSIVRRLRDAGFDAYLVGGCVRDSLMGISPKDWDIATAATPEAIQDVFDHTVGVGKAFGVVIVVLPCGDYEVATFRDEGRYSDGRRPDEVSFAGPEADVRRRDFTINALLYDPLAEEVLDFVGGVADIRNRCIRTVGDPHARFSEDYLRLVRAVRFAARTGFLIEPATWSAMVTLAELAGGVSGERLGDEMTRMLTEGASRRSAVLLEESGLLRVLLPEVQSLKGVSQPPEFHPEGDVWVHTLAMLREWDRSIQAMPARRPPGWRGEPREKAILGWAALLHDIGKPRTQTHADRIRFNGHDAVGGEMAETLLRRLRRPKWLISAVRQLVEHHMRFIHIVDMREARRRRFAASEFFPLHLELHRLDCLGSHGDLGGYEAGLAAFAEEQARPPPREPLLTGRDLIAAGYEPGPRMGTMLAAVDDARLEGILETRDQALAWVLRQFPRP